MIRFIIKRFLLMFIILLGITLLTFLMMHFAPGDPAEVIAFTRYGTEITPKVVEKVRVQEGLDAPLFVQYGKWLNHALHGDLGCSLRSGEPVLEEIFCRFPATFQIAMASMLISLVIAIPIGIISAMKQNSVIDYLSMTGALLGVSMPNFWLALLLILFFSVYLGWLPVFGRGEISHIILPAVTLGTGATAVITRLTRSSMLEVLGKNYIRTARAKGVLEKFVIGKHALKNAMIPVVTMIGLQIAFLCEGAVIVESIFAWPGIGSLLVDSIFARDFAVIQGCALFIAVIFVLANFIVDISYAYLDPRIRYRGEKR
jgi:peptide/nickel transport system permease protein